MHRETRLVRRSPFGTAVKRFLAGIVALSLLATGFMIREVADNTWQGSFAQFRRATADYESGLTVHSRRMQNVHGYAGDEDFGLLGAKYHPRDSERENAGRRVVAMDRFKADLPKIQTLQRNWILNHKRPADETYNMNVTASDVISLDRPINDTRPRACRDVLYDVTKLPDVSVIIPFYNEALSMLLRTVHSVLNRTPDRLLREIILVDDCSTHAYLKAPLDEYVSLLPKVKPVIRNAVREGLIRSRLKGSERSEAGILVFLDAHTECNLGWLEPLLAEVVRRPDTIAQPFVDGIDITNLEYAAPGDVHKGGFSWDLRYVWMRVPEHVERSAFRDGVPFWSPVPVGCALVVNKTYFNSIGAFDSSQNVWGGENLELGFRVWMCGGQVVTAPCSRVGHAFRIIPYSNKFDVVWFTTWQKNLIRVAEVWMDDYKQYFYKSTRVYEHRRVELSASEMLTLQDRKALREKLHCRSFEWYLNSVIPELPVPQDGTLYHGEMTNQRTNACWGMLPDDYIAMTYTCFQHKIIIENIFSITRDGLLLHKDKCVKFLFPAPNLKLDHCPKSREEIEKFGIWTMDYSDSQWGRLKVTLNNAGDVHTWCLEQVTSSVEPHVGAQMPNVAECVENDPFQLWSFTYRFDYDK